MTVGQDIEAKAEALHAKLEEKLDLRAKDLPRALAKAGRRLPRKHHRNASLLVEAQRLGGNPKLTRRVDMAALTQGYNGIMAYLAEIDPDDVRRGKRLALLGDIVAKLLFVTAMFVVWLWWSGTL